MDGFTLQLAAPPHHPAIGFAYPARALSRSASSSSLKSTSLKRKRSEQSMSITVTIAQTPVTTAPDAPLVLPIIFPSVDRDGNSHGCPGSPAPTEILDDVEEPGDVCMERAKATGVKVRDFAHEPLPKGRDPRAPEVWTSPLEALIMHDHYIRVAPRRADNYRLSGKQLHRLLALGWVTQEEAEFHWRDEDWKAVAEYVNRPLGAYPFVIPKGMKKPTAAYRAALRADKHVAAPDDIAEEKIFVPPDVPDMDDGPSRVDRAFLCEATAAIERGLVPFIGARPTTVFVPDPAPADDAGEPAHADKKRRLCAPTPTASTNVSPERTPPGTPAAAPALTQTPSRNSSSISTGSRSSSPPRAPPRLTRRRGGLARTETFDVIA